MIPKKKLQVFVSSTYVDLKEERQAAVEAILNAGHIPAGMELFAANDKSQMDVIRHWIDESDVYLLILGGRYGSIEPESGKSYIHLEYEYAIEKGMPHFALVINEKHLDEKVAKDGRIVLEQDNNKEFKAFKQLVTAQKVVRFWSDLRDIKYFILESLNEFEKRENLIGWIKGDQAVDSGEIAEQLARLSKENAELRDRISLQNETKFNGLTFQEISKIFDEEKIYFNSLSRFYTVLASGPKFSEVQTIIETVMADYIVYDVESVENNDQKYIRLLEGINFFKKELLSNDLSNLARHIDILFVAVRYKLIPYGFIDPSMKLSELGRQFVLKLIANDMQKLKVDME